MPIRPYPHPAEFHIIRDAVIFSPTDSDLSDLAQAHVAAWRTTYVGIVPDDHLANLSAERQEGRHRELMARQGVRYLAARDDASGRVVGFACGGPSRDPDAAEGEGELYAIYLLDSHHRRGIGSDLLRQLARQLATDGWRSCSAWVLADNPSRGFYDRLGGLPSRSQMLDIGGRGLEELRYVWPDIGRIAGPVC